MQGECSPDFTVSQVLFEIGEETSPSFDVGRIGKPSNRPADLPDGLPIHPTGKPILRNWSRTTCRADFSPPHNYLSTQRDSRHVFPSLI